MPKPHATAAVSKLDAQAETGGSPHAQPVRATGPAQQRGIGRRAVLALAAAGATAAGIGWGLRRQAAGAGNATAPTAGEQATASASAPTSAASGAATAANTVPATFWTQAFDRPQGGELKLAAYQGKPMLINFWATWCPPCVKEMPELDRFHSAFAPQGWAVLGLAVDSPTPVKAYLDKVKVGFDIGLAGFGGTELAQALGNDAGGLPFSVIVDAQGRIAHRKMGATSFEELSAWAKSISA
jgi:thiol-disulfide isomerase/thioredoxin